MQFEETQGVGPEIRDIHKALNERQTEKAAITEMVVRDPRFLEVRAQRARK